MVDRGQHLIPHLKKNTLKSPTLIRFNDCVFHAKKAPWIYEKLAFDEYAKSFFAWVEGMKKINVGRSKEFHRLSENFMSKVNIH